VPAFRIGRALVFDTEALDRWLAKHAERSIRTLSDTRGVDQ